MKDKIKILTTKAFNKKHEQLKYTLTYITLQRSGGWFRPKVAVQGFVENTPKGRIIYLQASCVASFLED